MTTKKKSTGTQAPDKSHYDEVTEARLLWNLLVTEKDLTRVNEFLKPRHFYIERYKWIYTAMLATVKDGDPPNPDTIADRLVKQRGWTYDRAFDEVAKLAQELPPGSFALDRDARRVIDLAARRNLQSLYQNIGRKLHSDPIPTSQIIADTEDQLAAIRQSYQSGKQQTRIQTYSADDILLGEFPDPDWVVPGLLDAGLTMFGGKSKIGKSWMALQLAQAVAAGGWFLGHELKKGAVWYMALEDIQKSLHKRMKQQGWSEGLSVRFNVVGEFKRQIGDLKNGASVHLADEIKAGNYRLVIIDTFAKTASWKPGDMNDYGVMDTVLDPLHVIALEQGCAIMLIDHHNKLASGDAVLDLLGSTGKGANCDTAWGIYKEMGKPGAYLKAIGRAVEEKEVGLTFDPQIGCWQPVATPGGVLMTANQGAIVDVMRAVENPITLTEIAEAVGREPPNVYQNMLKLREKDVVIKHGEGSGNIVTYTLNE